MWIVPFINKLSIMQENPYIEEIDMLVEKVLSRIEQEMPRSGYFAPVYENFRNNDEATKHIAGLFRLNVYKMPADIVPDPERRYIEASVFDSGGCYKTEMLVGSGNKDGIVAIMKSEKFRLKLYDTYIKLLDMLRD